MDYFPELIIATFVRHEDVQKALTGGLSIKYQCVTSSKDRWTFDISKVDFICPVRNCASQDDGPANKYLPIYVQQDRIEKYKQALAAETKQ